MSESRSNKRESSVTNVSFTSGTTGPYRLRKLPNGLFQIHVSGGPAFEGPKLKIFRKAIEFGVYRYDLRLAVKEMEKLDHDYADFGIWGRFLYTGRSKVRYAA